MGIDTRPFEPTIRFTTYLLLPSDRPHGLLTQRFAQLLGEMLAEATEPWQALAP